jgi:phage/plasmid-associated DNA primase
VDKEWCERFDFNPYQIAYKNGILCLKTNTFRAGLLPTDYLTKTLPYEYEEPNEKEVAWVREELKKICNYNEEHLERYLSQIGYMLCGDPSKIQEFYNFKGEKAGNGKSSILDALTHIIPTLVKKLDSNVFEKSAKATLHKSIATLLGVRIAWINEVDASAIQDEGTIKTIRDGMNMSYNEMYGVNMSMTLSCKLVVVGNNGMKVKGDAGIMRSMVINQFDSEFPEDATENDYVNRVFIRDTEFIKKLIEKKHSLLGLFYQYSKKFWEEKKLKPMPKEWKDEKEQVREGLAKFDKWFDINYEWAEGRDDWTAWIDDIENHAKMEKMKHDDIKCELKRMKLWKKPVIYDSQARSHKKKGVFRNIRMREEKPIPMENAEV